MAINLKQDERFFHLDTPLGGDKLLVAWLKGREEMSALFSFELELVSEDFDIDPDALIGKPVTIGMRHIDPGKIRYFNGYVSRFELIPAKGRLARYRAMVVPWLWFLTRTTDCFIYQKKSVPEVVKATFQKYGFQEHEHFELPLQQPHTAWEYCSQYRETAFSYVSRLFEEEGIFYFFRHEKGKHVLIAGDFPTVHQPCPLQSRIQVERLGGRGPKRSEDAILRWESNRKFRSSQWAHRDFNFLTPETTLQSDSPSRFKTAAAAKWEKYDYPGEYEERKDGDDWAKLRMQEEEVPHQVAGGESNALALAPGFRFDLVGHDRRDENQPYVVTAVEHEGHEGSFLSGDDAAEATYVNRFQCIPYSTPYTPKRKTPKHIMRGVQTATVVGLKGEEIYTDPHGRVKVQFHWDREGKKDENSSCWVRVSQPWAGKNWGAMFLPRVGQEVIVDFVEGDPDRPIITGRVYNNIQKPVWELPKRKNWSGFKTRSTKDGSAENYNELRFDDTKGDELFLLHAEKDMELTVEHDTRETIDHDRILEVKNDQKETIKGEKTVTVKKNHTEKVEGTVRRTVGQSEYYQIAANFTVVAGGEIHLKAGARIVFEAGAGISFLGPGGNFIDVNPLGLVLQGNVILLNSGIGLPGGGLGIPGLPGLPGLPGIPGLPGLPALPGVGSIAGGLGAAFNGAVAAAGGMLAQAGGALGALAAGALGGGALGQLGQGLGGPLGQLGQSLGGAIGAASGGLGSMAGMLGGNLASAIPGAGVLGNVSQLLSGAVSAGGGALAQVSQLLGGALPGGDALNQVLQSVQSQVSGGMNGLMQSAQAFMGGAGALPAGMTPMGQAGALMSEVMSSQSSALSQLVQAAGQPALSQAAEALQSVVSSGGGALGQAVNALSGAAIQGSPGEALVSQALGQMNGATTSGSAALADAGQALSAQMAGLPAHLEPAAQALQSGLKSTHGALAQAAGALGRN